MCMIFLYIFTSRPTLRNILTHVKPKIKQEEKIGIIYKIPCECGDVYIGETGWTLKQREHKRAIRKADPSNAIATHTATTLHAIAWKESEVIDLESHWERRRIKEAIHIKKTPRTLNTDPGIILNPSWYTLLQRSWHHHLSKNTPVNLMELSKYYNHVLTYINVF